MPSHRAAHRPLRPVVAALILVTTACLTIWSVQRLGDADPETRAGSTAIPTAESSPVETVPVKAVADDEAAKATSPRKHSQPTPADTLTKPACRPQRVDETITVLSYNIKSGQYGLARVVAAIKAADADVVLLQEVDRFQARSGVVDMPTYLSQQLEMNAAFGANVADGRSQHGTAILSRFPIEEEWNALLPNRRGGEQRGLLHTVLNVRGLRLSVYGTQLEQRSQPVQLQQISAIKSIVVEDPKPKLLGGDFSSPPSSPVLRIAFSALADPWAAGVGKGSPSTSPAARPRARVDYLLHRGVALEPLRAEVLASKASDHRAVRASYRLTGNAGSVCRD